MQSFRTFKTQQLLFLQILNLCGNKLEKNSKEISQIQHLTEFSEFSKYLKYSEACISKSVAFWAKHKIQKL